MPFLTTFFLQGDGPITLPGVTLGAYALDGCSSPLRSENLVSSLYSGGLRLRSDKMEDVDLSKVAGWLVYTDENTLKVGSTLGRLGKCMDKTSLHIQFWSILSSQNNNVNVTPRKCGSRVI